MGVFVIIHLVKFYKFLFVVFALFFCVFNLIPQVYASGATIQTDQQLQVTQQGDGTMFVSTTLVASDSGVATPPAEESPNSTATNTGIFIKDISVPMAFAKDVGSVINFVLRIVMIISILLVFGYLIWGAFEWIVSGGDKTKTEAARNKIISAVVGLIIVASSYAAFLLILRFIGFKDLNDALRNVGTIRNPNVASSSAQIASPSTTPLREQNLVK